ncbi:MAG: ATP-binding protein [Thermoprotei archaeon]|nr:MAG: ATP-binding protein [Thermoprotei archaeon]
MVIINMIIVKRFRDEERLEKLPRNLLIYGRRKTGKTFLIKHLFKNSHYFFVKRGGGIFYENLGENLEYKAFIILLDRLFDEGKLVIIDEFHRLPDEFLDYLHLKAPLNVILITSTLHLVKKILKPGSPLTGLFYEYRLDLIDERDILVNLKEYIADPFKLVEYSVYLREPILLRSFTKDIELFDILKGFRLTVPALLGEIFTEEERGFSAKYEGILRAIASGKARVGEIAGYLYSRSIIRREDHGLVTSFIDILCKLGLLGRIREYSGRRYYYYLSSPMIDLYYYLDEKYNFSERDLDVKYFREKLPHHVETFFRNLLAKIFNLTPAAVVKPYEIDVALVEFNKLRVVAEVKWRKSLDKSVLRRIERKLSSFRNVRRILIVPSESILPERLEDIEVWDVQKIIDLIKAS